MDRFEQQAWIDVARVNLNAGVPHRAWDALMESGAIMPQCRGLMARCGDSFVDLGDFLAASQAYRAAGKEFTTETCILCGDNALEKPNIWEAFLAYRAANHRPGFRRCVERALELGRLDIAQEAAMDGGEPISEDALEAYGLAALKNDATWFGFAVGAFRAAKKPLPAGEVAEFAHRAMGEGAFETASEAYASIGDLEGVAQCGRQLLAKGKFLLGIRVLRYTQALVSPQEAFESGLVAFQRDGGMDDAVAAFEHAEHPFGLKACGEKAEKNGDRELALRAFRLAAELRELEEEV